MTNYLPYLIEQNGRKFKHEKRLCFPGLFFAVLARNPSFQFIFLCFTWKTTSLLHRDETFLKNNHNSQIYSLQRTDTLKVGVIIKRTELPVKIRNKERQYLLWIRIYPSDISRRRGKMSWGVVWGEDEAVPSRVPETAGLSPLSFSVSSSLPSCLFSFALLMKKDESLSRQKGLGMGHGWPCWGRWMVPHFKIRHWEKGP